MVRTSLLFSSCSCSYPSSHSSHLLAFLHPPTSSSFCSDSFVVLAFSSPPPMSSRNATVVRKNAVSPSPRKRQRTPLTFVDAAPRQHLAGSIHRLGASVRLAVFFHSLSFFSSLPFFRCLPISFRFHVASFLVPPLSVIVAPLAVLLVGLAWFHS